MGKKEKKGQKEATMHPSVVNYWEASGSGSAISLGPIRGTLEKAGEWRKKAGGKKKD